MRRGSEDDYYKFIVCLHNTGQSHAYLCLIEGGVVAHLVAKINREERERQIVDKLNTLLKETPEERLGELSELLDQLRAREVSLIFAQRQNSIGLFYLCRSLRGLQYLYEIYSTQQLNVLMQEIFISLDSDGTMDLRVNLRWDLSSYIDCLQQLYTFMNLPILSYVCEMTKQKQEFVSMCDDIRSLPIDQLPLELTEIILIQATGRLFVTINRTTPTRAAVYTLATMMAVSRLWWEALSYRKYIKRKLKWSFKGSCHPFECRPQHVTSLHIEGGNYVMGVATLNNELYVACGGSNMIQVFDSRPPFSHRDDIKVRELKSAIDITVCRRSSQLYIADEVHCAIWRVNLLSIELAEKFITSHWKPWRLESVRLLQ